MLRSSRLPRVLSSVLALVAPLLLTLPSAADPAKPTTNVIGAKTETTKKKTTSAKTKTKKKKPVAEKSTKDDAKKPLPPLPKKETKTAQKPVDSEDPPVELTGALPEAKYVDAKPKKKKTDDAKAEKGDDKKVDDKAAKAKKDGKEKSAPTPRPEAPFDLGGTEKVNESKKPKIKTCLNPAVTFARLGQPTDVSFVLTTCKGRVAPGAVEYLSVLGRPYDLPPPKWMDAGAKGELGLMSQSIATLAMKQFENTSKTKSKKKSAEEDVAPGIRRLDPGLVVRLQAIAAHFPNKTITLVSGYRPQSKGSPHSFGRAFDVRIDGVTNETLVAFCKTLKDTGCGYYPNSYFVHVDVRPSGAGHVFWIDVSGPGEKPKYVKDWPPKLPPLPEPKPNATPTTLPTTIDPDTGKAITATTDESTIGDVEEAAPSMDPPTTTQ